MNETPLIHPGAVKAETQSLKNKYIQIRHKTEKICAPLQTEDYVVQPVVDVSPPKWHLGHSTWFFETFLLKTQKNYKEYDPAFNFVFNSYYETIGARVLRTDRGNLSRPTVSEVYAYRKYVDEAMLLLIDQLNADQIPVLLIGLNHEQQHQELLLTDIKYILGHNPLFPAYHSDNPETRTVNNASGNVRMDAGNYDIGYKGNDFCFDNELQPHTVHLNAFAIAKSLVTNGEYIHFIEDGGYRDFRYWHSEGWDWVQKNNVTAPLYWHSIKGEWMQYTLAGLVRVDAAATLCHISYFEASAFAAWKGARLPTEFEWEAASDQFSWGTRWEWTESAYLPYPGYKKAPGAIGEYNGKFMISQMVLRGASVATPEGHSRKTYRNFFHPWLRWQYTGIRLCY